MLIIDNDNDDEYFVHPAEQRWTKGKKMGGEQS